VLAAHRVNDALETTVIREKRGDNAHRTVTPLTDK
jgi:hypothetical protein